MKKSRNKNNTGGRVTENGNATRGKVYAAARATACTLMTHLDCHFKS